MINLKNVITDSQALRSRYIYYKGFAFTSVTYPANIFDAIIIKHPHNIKCSSPQITVNIHGLQEYIDFVNENNIEKALIIANNIDFITKCPCLKHIRIVPADDAEDNFDYSPLYQLPQVKSLQCPVAYGVGKQFCTKIDCSQINGLESFNITDFTRVNYNTVYTLKSLGISNYKGIDLNDVVNSRVLDTLTVIKSKIISLKGLSKSNNMQCLYLYDNRSLQDIRELGYAKDTLRALRIDNCPKIEDFSVLNELHNLEFLELSGSNTLSSLSFIKNMSNLKTFVFNMNVVDGNLLPCLDLSYVYSERDRKHFNLKDKDLPKGKYVCGNEDIEEWRRLF